MALDDVLDEVRAHFGRYSRPDDFIDAAHCCECAEHYAELADVTVDDLAKEHVGDGAWDPTCFLTSEGFRYYFPGLARIATEDRDWLEMLLPRLSGHYVECFSAEDLALVQRLLDEWWLDEGTSEWTRDAISNSQFTIHNSCAGTTGES